jgi:hypothetical protein
LLTVQSKPPEGAGCPVFRRLPLKLMNSWTGALTRNDQNLWMVLGEVT